MGSSLVHEESSMQETPDLGKGAFNNEQFVKDVCKKHFNQEPQNIIRFSTGLANRVYKVEFPEESYVLRISESGSYDDAISYLKTLKEIGVPVPSVIANGTDRFDYMIISFVEGGELGSIYQTLTREDKNQVAKEIVAMQEKVAALSTEDFKITVDSNWSWINRISAILAEAEKNISEKGYFITKRVNLLRGELENLREYLPSVKPTPYLDDISTKNLFIKDGHISGIIDVDEIGYGDVLDYVAMTNVALLNEGYDTDYVDFILDEMKINEDEKRAFLFYSLMYCTVFMGERGQTFENGATVAVNDQIIDRLNSIYEKLLKELKLRSKKSSYVG